VCVMEVRAGQRSSTIAQACAHNTATVERDVNMFRKLLEARGDTAKAADLAQAQRELQKAEANLLELFGEFVSAEYHPVDGLGEDHGSERTFVAQAAHDARLARRYETR
jgi:hypothetical protein